MPSKATGRIFKANRHKVQTPHQKNHRWETFTTKISKFNSLQPLRKVRRHDLESEDLSAATSYFQNGLQKWGELNVSKPFVAFKREVLPISESLAQILHFEKRIMALLAAYISLHEKEALEPLLDLLTAFAHDLGVRFEKHYAQSLSLIASIAGRPQDVEVIEWTFGALAFLFKYLSKLLLPDLRPTYDIVSPLLGKARHPPHIARFAAEALSFLVKKACGPSHRETSLPLFIQHVKKDLCDTEGDRQFLLYKDGIMTMFAEAIKGTENSVHSAGHALFPALMAATIEKSGEEGANQLTPNEIWMDVVCGVLTSIIHHSTPETFNDFCEAILETIKKLEEEFAENESCSYRPHIRILGTLAGVRKGSRPRDWPLIVETLVGILGTIAKLDEHKLRSDDAVFWNQVMVHVAIVWHHAPIDSLIPSLSRFTQSLTKGPLMRWFIPFCSYCCDLDSARFGSLLRGDFQRFIADHWSQGTYQDMLCVFLPKMIETQAFPAAGERDSCRLPQGWQDQIVSKFETLEISPFPERGPQNKDPQVWRDRCLPKYSALLRLLELVTVHPSTNARIAELLLRKLKLALRPSSTLASDEVHFVVSRGFRAYLRMSKAGASVDRTLSPLLRAAVPRFARSVGFLKAYLDYEHHVHADADSEKSDGFSSDGSSSDVDPVITSLVENLSSSSHDVRLASLQLLKLISPPSGAEESVTIMLDVEQLPLDLDHTRTIAMLLRNLAKQYSALEDGTWVAQGVPSFLFGMLNVKLSPVWDNATEALQVVTQVKHGEDAVSAMAFKWLAVSSPRWSSPSQEHNSSNYRLLTDFDCTCLNSLRQRAETTQIVMDNSDESIRQDFNENQRTAPLFAPYARSRALKLFNAIPSLAEKKSRLLVPHFLSWASEDDELQSDQEINDSYWSLADRKGMLAIFSKFINPKVLYQHSKVYDSILELMASGDVEVQKLVLKAILAWKQEGVKAYQENLEFLLDEARFKNELTAFLQGDSVIKPEHRPELMPVLLRLLYGRIISKKGAGSGKHGLQATRLSVLRTLSIEDIGDFIDIAKGDLKNVEVVVPPQQRESLFDQAVITPRKQVGFLNLTMSLISELGVNVVPYMDKIINPVLYCLIFACRHLRDTSNLDHEDALDENDDLMGSHSLLKVARSSGIKCLNMLFQNAQTFQWDPFHELIIEEVVAPRLENLSAEMTQGVSGVMELFSTWSSLPRAALFLAPHKSVVRNGVLPPLIECLAAEKTKDKVKIFILGIFRNLIRIATAPAHESEFNELIQTDLLDPNARSILATITTILEKTSTSNDLLDTCVETMLSIATVLRDGKNVESVMRICSFLLQQPPRRVNPRTKGRILLVVDSFVALIEPSSNQGLRDEVYDTLSSLFSYFKDRENRQSLCRVISALSQGDDKLTEVSRLCADLNSYQERRIDEPNYDVRLKAFSSISQARDSPLTPQQWLPVLHNCIFFIRMDQEFGVLSTNSADGMRRFVQDAADCHTSSKDKLKAYMKDILLPTIYAGAKEPSDTVRREILRVLGFILSKMPEWDPVKDMSGLLAESQQDSSEPLFFFNILSPATARQLEAIQMLESANSHSEIGSQNLAQFFLPLLENFIFGRTDGSDDHGLGARASSTIGTLAMSLHWKHYRSTLHRYMSYISSKPEMLKQTIRLLGHFTDALALSAQSSSPDLMETDQLEATSSHVRRLTLTLPKHDQLQSEIVNFFLPMLVKHLHEKDESEVSYRVPVGITIVKLLKLLSTEEMDQKLAGVLTDISHILRSKAWESRDMARDTLVKIAALLGPSHFGFILKELRGALTRGYQLHVLSYTMHSILVANVPSFAPGDLDYCLPSIVIVILDDIFGVIGQEKDAEGYISQMKEVKSSKSQDSMELISKTASISRLIHLVKPLQALLMQKVDLKMIRKIDTLMARITAGLLQNPAAESRDTLVFCYEVIQQVYQSKQPEVEQKLDPRVRKYLVQRGARKGGDRGKTTRNAFKLTRFAFDILRSILKKHDSLRTPENLAGFLPIFGDAILDGEDEIKISTFRLLAVIVKVPFDNDDGANIYKVAVKEATKAISTSSSTTTELSQAALKMLSVVLRDRRDVLVKDAAIDLLLGKLKDDLTEPQHRHVTFNFLRSVLERRIETAAVYDTMDHVGTVMITNDDKDTRDLARGAFFQFIREYPQKKARWAKQLNFIVANLKYDREGGRLSIMEVIHLLLMKSSDDFVQEVAATCFLPLFFVLANDDSDKCKLAASQLLKNVFQRSDKERTQKFLGLLRSWLDKDDNPTVLRLAIIVWSHYFESNEGAPRNSKDYQLVFGKVSGILDSDDLNDVDGELMEAITELTQAWVTAVPEKVLSSTAEGFWSNITRCLRHPHAPVRLASIKLISQYLSGFAKSGSLPHLDSPIEGSYGLQLDTNKIQNLVRRCLYTLNGRDVDEPLAAEAGQILIFLGPSLPIPPRAEDVDVDVDVDQPKDEDDDEDQGVETKQADLQYLFWRLSHILRKEVRPKAAAIVPKVTAMEVLETISRRTPRDRLEPCFQTILVPLHNLTDPTIPAPQSVDEEFKARHEGLKTRAQIVMDSLQKKFGTTEYSKHLMAIREAVKTKREQRSSKRKIEAIAQPEKYGRDKRKKFEKNKTRKKFRSAEQKAMRQSYKGW